ncbi:MAG: elongation factor [Rikenellaceae bacterium]|nr:elongation factor [Rikenellaceae bacterium]
MKDLTPLRNIGIIAHIDAGKTTTTERILYYTGVNYSIGEVDNGTATTDWMPQEQERGITITSAATTVHWILNDNDYQINIIDTPGHVDFTVEVERSLRVLDGSIVIFCGVAGVQPQSETVWRQADKYRVPRICYINKLDRPGADFFKAIHQIKDKLGATPIPIQLPIFENDTFDGIIDLISLKAIYWDLNNYPDGSVYTYKDIPEHLKSLADEYRSNLLETISELDDDIMSKFFNDPNSITNEEILKNLRKGTLSLKFTPVLCGSSLQNIGVQPLIDAVINYLPSPADIGIVEGINPKTGEKTVRKISDDEPLSALIFKVINDPYVGRIAFTRLYSGVISQGDMLYNSRLDKKERAARLFHIHANKQIKIDSFSAGDIAAIVGLKDSTTGDTLCDNAHPIAFESIHFPDPVISIAIEAKYQKDITKMVESLQKIADEDPSLWIKTDEETGQIILNGMGELHLDIVADRLAREYNIECNLGRPQVNYREGIIGKTTHREIYKKQFGGKGKYAELEFELSGNSFDSVGLNFENLLGKAVSKDIISAIEKGFRSAMQNGVIAGYTVLNAHVRLLDVVTHPVDSDALSFEIAASIAFKEACKNLKIVLLEPIMRLEIISPIEYIGEITSDITRRRGEILNIEGEDVYQVIRAEAPLAELFGYVTILRSLSSGRASVNMEFKHYAVCPDLIAEEVIFKTKGIKVNL